MAPTAARFESLFICAVGVRLQKSCLFSGCLWIETAPGPRH